MPRLFGDKLRYLRTQHHLKQEELAQQLGLASHSHVSYLETGRREPSLSLILQAANVFGVTTDYLLRDDIDTIAVQLRGESLSNPKALTMLGIRLRELRLAHGLQQAELARKLQIQTQAFISLLEAGKKLPSPDLLVRIASVFNVSTDLLLKDELINFSGVEGES